MSDATIAAIEDGQGEGTILNNDDLPTLGVGDVRISGDSGTVNAVFTVRLSAASTQPVTVVAQTANGTALAGSDYTAVGPVTLNFPPGTISQPVTSRSPATPPRRPDETFAVNLSGAINATIFKPQGVGTILDDDTPIFPGATRALDRRRQRGRGATPARPTPCSRSA